MTPILPPHIPAGKLRVRFAAMGLVAMPGRRLFAFLARRQVVLSSPHPPAECGRRLEAVTGRRLFGRNGGLLLQGRVSPALIRVAIRQPAGSRNSVVAWFVGRIEQGPDGGTLVAGTIGPDEASQAVFAVISGVWALLVPTMLAVGVASLVSGHPELPFLLIPIAFLAVYAGMLVILPAKAQREIQQLLDELNMILDSSAALAQTG
jgi:hypothetical protein